jgi:hypothetical protein
MTTAQYLALMGAIMLVPASITLAAWFCLTKLDKALDEWMNK